ncbi:hypothetical protein D3C75_695400 [compost metagenome]
MVIDGSGLADIMAIQNPPTPASSTRFWCSVVNGLAERRERKKATVGQTKALTLSRPISHAERCCSSSTERIGKKQRNVPRIRIRYMRLTNRLPGTRGALLSLSVPFITRLFRYIQPIILLTLKMRIKPFISFVNISQGAFHQRCKRLQLFRRGGRALISGNLCNSRAGAISTCFFRTIKIIVCFSH